MLESGAQATGQQSWVTGGSTYPWPLHQWVDARVDPNSDSLSITSVLQDAQAHSRWHLIGDGYTPRPGDWVLFDEHVEVVTKYADGVLYTIGGDSGSNLSVNAHQYDGPLAAAGVAGFVNNGELASAVSQSSGSTQASSTAPGAAAAGDATKASGELAAATEGQASVPGLVTPALALGLDSSGQAAGQQAQSQSQSQSQSGGSAAAGPAVAGTASIPGARPIAGTVTSYSAAPATAPSSARNSPAPSSARYSRSQPAPATESVSDTPSQQAFINSIAPGALAAQRQYGVPAAVTIAQAIDESGWGQSLLATQDNNLFGIKGTGPAGSVLRPTEEYENGQPVGVTAPFRVYSNVAQSIADHSLLLATGSSYKQAMADRRSPDAFANDLTGVYATDPNYGASLISLMRQYNLYRFDPGASEPAAGTTAAQGAAGTSAPSHAKATSGGSAQSTPTAQSTSAQSSVAHGSPAQSSLAQNSPGASSPGLSSPAQSTVTQSAAIPGAIAVNGTVLGVAAHQATGQAASGHATAGQAGTAAAGGGAAAPSGSAAVVESWAQPAFRVCWTPTPARPRRPRRSRARSWGRTAGGRCKPVRARRGSAPGAMSHRYRGS